MSLKTNVSKMHQLGTERFRRFSDCTRLVSAFSVLRHIASSFKTEDKLSCSGWHTCEAYKSPESLSRAENQIIMECQWDTFSSEIELLRKGQPLNKDSPVLVLSPYLDVDGLLRVGGRLKHAKMPVREKNPILIVGQYHIATLFIRHYHREIQHQGRQFTEGAVRSAGYWITGGKEWSPVSFKKCVKCWKMQARMCHQRMADLPPDCLTPSPPFIFVGVDVFGPWEVSTQCTRGGSACS